MSWEKAKALADKHSTNGGLFVKLAKNGDKVTGAFSGEPYAREVIWTGKTYEDFDPANPEHQGADRKPTFRAAINIFVVAEKAMKVIEGGTAWFKDLMKVKEKYGQDTWTFEIERHGDANDPKTTYSILPDSKIDADLRQLINEAKQHSLEALYRPHEKGSKPAAPATKTVPFIAAEVAGEFLARLKSQPKPVVTQFLSTFGVSRIRDLRANQEAEARAFLSEREAAPAAEVNPFE